MEHIYKNYIVEDNSAKPQFPKLYVYDSEESQFVDAETIKTLLNVADSEASKIKNFFGQAISLPKKQIIPVDSLPNSTQQRYIMFYYNLPEDAYAAAYAFHPTIAGDHDFLINRVTANKDMAVYTESIRVCRRLIILRELANEQTSNLFPRSTRACSSHGFDIRA
ncbi:MAG: hypothetical protein MK188_15905 [Gammaproteobacteria bacterium]|nr:hypothetical protein [Gammaproteobacteria bacterium]